MAWRWDVHTHVGLDQAFFLRGWWPYASTVQDLLQHMAGGGIDRAVCFPFVLGSAFDPVAFADHDRVTLLPGRAPYDRENALLCAECGHQDDAGRLLPFAMFDPARAVDAQLQRLEGLVGRIGGLKTQTTVLQSPIRALLGPGRGLLDLAEQHGLPVLFHTAVAPADRWAQVRDCLDVAAARPRIRFNLAHSLRFCAPLLREAASLPNVWVDCAAHLIHCDLARADHPAVAPADQRVDADYGRPADVLQAIHAVLDGRYLWGSDNPYMSWCDEDVRMVHDYRSEAAALAALPQVVEQDMSTRAPVAWLFGDEGETGARP